MNTFWLKMAAVIVVILVIVVVVNNISPPKEEAPEPTKTFYDVVEKDKERLSGKPRPEDFVGNSQPPQEQKEAAEANLVLEVESVDHLKDLRDDSSDAKPLIVLYTMPGCGPCQRYRPDFYDQASMLGDRATFAIVKDATIDENYDVKRVPTVRIFRGDEQKDANTVEKYDLEKVLDGPTS